MRLIVASNSLLTHTPLLVATIAADPSPTPMMAVTLPGTGPPGWPVAGSILVTVPSPLFATQTASRPTAMPCGRPPTWTVLVTVPVTGSIRFMVSSPSLATHTPLGPLAMAIGRLPTRIVWTTLLAAALIRETVLSPLLVIHT